MADLTDIQAAGSVKIIGSDATGLEGVPVNSTLNGDLQADDTTRAGGSNATVTLAGSAVEVKVGASRLTTRKYVIIMPSVNSVKWGFSVGSQTFDVFKNQLLILPLGPNTPIYINGTGMVEIGEV